MSRLHRNPLRNRQLALATLAIAGATLCVTALGISPIRAEDRPADHNRWSAAAALQLGILGQEAHGSAQSSRRPPSQPGTKQFGDNTLLDYYFGVSLELMTPSIADVAGQPQLFVQVGVHHPLGLEVDIAREGAPDGFVVPDFGSSDSTLPASAVGGQGMKTEAEFTSPTVTAGAGVSFSFELWERQFRIRPSVQYLFEQVEISGIMLDADGQQVIEDFVIIEDFQLLRLGGRTEEELHGLGGGLELEVDVLRTKSGIFSIAAGAHAYRILSDRRFEFTSTDGTDFATWGTTMDPVVYRGGFAFRYRYLPR